MKKYLSIILALVLILSLSVPALALEDDQRQTELSFYYYAEYEPVYYVTIPDALGLDAGDNYLEISACGENIDNKMVLVTFEGTQSWVGTEYSYTYYNLLLWRNGEPAAYETDTLFYDLYAANGSRVNTDVYGDYVANPGIWLAEFYLNNIDVWVVQTLRININPYSEKNADIFQPDNPYSGFIVFGISMVD